MKELSRRGINANRLAVGLLKELRVLPLLTTLTAAALPILLARGSLNLQAGLFFLALAFLLYAVHALDTYEDYFVRKEDRFKTFTFGHGASGYLTKGELKAAVIFCSLAFMAITAWIASFAGPIFPIPVIAAFAIGVSYSRTLSKNIVTSSIAYPLGAVLAMASAYILGGASNWASFASLAVPVFLLLVGVKVLMDAADAKTDARTKRPNIANAYGEKNAKLCSLAFLAGGLAVSLAASFSLVQLVVSLLLAAVFLKSFFSTPGQGIWLAAPGVYLFLLAQAGLILAS